VKALFLGNVAADTAEGIRSELPPELKLEIIANPKDLPQSPEAAAEADILVTNIWRADYPPAPQVRLVQSVATGIEWIEQAALPRGVAVCNAYGHETAIAEYVLMTMLALSHQLLDIATAFRAGTWTGGGAGGGPPHGEVLGKTIGIVGYGRIGREIAKRAVAFGCKIIAANRSPIGDPGAAAEIYPLGELDRMLPQCDVVVIAAGLGAETRGLIDANRLALMKPTALLINIGRALIVDEAALYNSLRDGRIGGAALDVWWRYPSPAEPNARPSHLPFHELPNVLMTPHCSSGTDGARDRRQSVIAGNLDRFARGEELINVVTRT
jgi:phosphoglycerate dehydrogenase-like enzyme